MCSIKAKVVLEKNAYTNAKQYIVPFLGGQAWLVNCIPYRVMLEILCNGNNSALKCKLCVPTGNGTLASSHMDLIRPRAIHIGLLELWETL